jgi:hypothetical protein
MKKLWLCVTSALLIPIAPAALAAGNSNEHPGCALKTPTECIELALRAMGGRDRLLQLSAVHLQTIGHTLLVEQSYRQDPFVTAYERDDMTLDLTNGRLRRDAKITWPESDAGHSESEITLIVGPEGGVYRNKDGDSPCRVGDLHAARQLLSLGPARLLLTASTAADLHYESVELVRGTRHAVVAFTWNQIPVRVLLNPFNQLPDAVETTQVFQDMWYFWGDVRQRIYFDNWKFAQGIIFPTNLVEERNGIVWSSAQALDVQFDGPTDDEMYAMDSVAAKGSVKSHAWDRPFSPEKATALAPGIDLFPGSWNSTIVKQPDGLVILEAPISEFYTKAIIEEARKRYPGSPIKAILSTSDSWPHIGGVRFAVSQAIPVYILDLNRPLLDRIVRAPHNLDSDELSRTKQTRGPLWKIVSGRVELGSGENRMELYPLHGASTERQYMVYFPGYRLLYASDTLAFHSDGTLYDPELMHEVAQAVARENLQVNTVFAMHQGPTPWDKVMALIESAQRG